MEQVFTKARQNRVFEDVIHQVEDAIVNGDLKPGDRLPPERELRKMLDVGRGTLRESLRVLEQKGLIEIKTGAKGGIFVKKLSSDQMSENLGLFVRSHQVTLGHLAQFREDVEGLVAARAARRIKPAEAGNLEKLLEKAERLLQTGPEAMDEFLEADKNIHLALAKIAGNPIHYFFLEIVHDNVHQYNLRVYLPRGEEIMREIFQDLTELVESVVRGDDDQALALTREHIVRFNTYMEQAAPKAPSAREGAPGAGG